MVPVKYLQDHQACQLAEDIFRKGCQLIVLQISVKVKESAFSGLFDSLSVFFKKHLWWLTGQTSWLYARVKLGGLFLSARVDKIICSGKARTPEYRRPPPPKKKKKVFENWIQTKQFCAFWQYRWSNCSTVCSQNFEDNKLL